MSDHPFDDKKISDKKLQGPDDNLPEVTPESTPIAVETIPENSNIKGNYSIQTNPLSELKELNPDRSSISLPSDHSSNVGKVLATTQETHQIQKEGLEILYAQDGLRAAADNPEALYQQDLGDELKSFYPNTKPNPGQKLTGKAAIYRAKKRTGIGAPYRFPLWSSGLWVTMMPVEVSPDLINLNRSLLSDKIEMGRYTYGLVYSNAMAYTIGRLVSFAIEHMTDYTLNLATGENIDLGDIISCQDIFPLINGLAATIFQTGYQYERGCSIDPTSCNHISRGLIHFNKLTATNKRALSDWQLNFMSNRKIGNRSLDDLKRYKEESLIARDRSITIGQEEESFKIILQVPTINQYINAGTSWISGIAEMVDSVLGTDASTDNRNQQIDVHCLMTVARRYAHWVKAIQFSDDEIVDDPDSIGGVLGTLSTEETIREEIESAINQYINDTTLSIVGIPVYECPNCHKEQVSGHDIKGLKNIIPIDITNAFFIITNQYLSDLTRRTRLG